jgi:amino acid permease
LYVYLLMNLAGYFIVLSQIVQAVFFEWHLCRPQAALIAAALMIPTNQLRTLHHLTPLSVVSFLTIVIVLVIYIVTILGDAGASVEEACVGNALTQSNSFTAVAHDVSQFVFAFSGQKIFLEMQAEMKEPNHFLRSLHLAYPALLTTYMVITSVSFGRCGLNTPSYIMNALGYDWTRILANSLLFIHIVVSYTISQQVLARAIALRVLPAAAIEEGPKARCQWFAITAIQLFFGWLVSNVVPLFDDFVSLLSSLLSTQMSFSFPCVLYLALRRQKQIISSPLLDKAITFMCLATVLVAVFFTMLGAYASIKSIAEHASTIAAPFSCLCTARTCANPPE